MEDFPRDEHGRVMYGLIHGFALGTQAPKYVLMKFVYYPNKQAHEANQQQEITLRIERQYAKQLGDALAKLATDPNMPFTEGTA